MDVALTNSSLLPGSVLKTHPLAQEEVTVTDLLNAQLGHISLYGDAQYTLEHLMLYAQSGEVDVVENL